MVRSNTVALLGILLALALSGFGAQAKTVRYTLTVENKPVNVSGKKTVDFALTVNGGIPAPTLEFTEGDDAEITVDNRIAGEQVSIHWHGLLLPPEEDGVAYVNTPPIFSGKSRTFKFKIRQHGTYWYHSHTGLQEQKGVFGAIVIHPKKKVFDYDSEAVVLLTDWTDENPDSVLAHLRKDGDYYQYKKNSIRSYWGALRAGGLKTMLANEWTRMGGMDVSDVGYDAFLINGKRDSQLRKARPGERVRLRVINAAASSYFYLSLAGLPMRVISADGTDIAPVETKELLVGMAETYDILFTVPDQRNYELRATCQDVTGHASAWIGSGEQKVFAPDKPRPDLYAPMDHGGHAGHGGHAMSAHGGHDMHSGHGHHMPEAPAVRESISVDDLVARQSTQLPAGKPTHDVKLVLGGDMRRYVWHLNGKAIHQDRDLEIREGEIVRLTLVNETMMHHPIHLHGHFFRVLTASGDKSPLKHTVDVPPHTTRTIEFYANEPGQWMLHCHNLYHMKTGMARVVKYSSFKPSPTMAAWQDGDPHMHDHTYNTGMLEFSTNHARAQLRRLSSWSTLELHAETRSYEKSEEIQGNLYYRRWFSNYLSAFAGGVRFNDYKVDKNRAVLGVGYILPLLIETNLMVDHRGEFRLDLNRKFQWTRRIYSELEVSFRQNQETEYEISLMYAPNWEWSAGLMLTEDNVGAGVQYRF